MMLFSGNYEAGRTRGIRVEELVGGFATNGASGQGIFSSREQFGDQAVDSRWTSSSVFDSVGHLILSGSYSPFVTQEQERGTGP